MMVQASRCLRRRRKCSPSNRLSIINNRQPRHSRVINPAQPPVHHQPVAPQPQAYQPAQQPMQQQQPVAQQPAPSPQDSLIHPLLMRNGDSRPLQRPTTPLPSLDLLTPPPSEVEPVDTFALEQMARLVEARLADFRIKADVVNYSPGPVITRFELNLAPGVKAARISNLSRDLARSLSTVAVRVVEVIPGKPYVGTELPNKKTPDRIPARSARLSEIPREPIAAYRGAGQRYRRRSGGSRSGENAASAGCRYHWFG